MVKRMNFFLIHQALIKIINLSPLKFITHHNIFINQVTNQINHFLDILDDLEIADPPDFTETDPFDESMSTELGALLGRSILFYFKKSSIKGPKSGKSSPKFLTYETST